MPSVFGRVCDTLVFTGIGAAGLVVDDVARGYRRAKLAISLERPN